MSPSPCPPAPSKLCIVIATLWSAAGCHAAPAVVGRTAPPPEPSRASASAPGDTLGMGRFLDSLLARMTLEEKLGQLNQPGGPGNDTGPAARAGSEADIRAGRIGSFLGVSGADETRKLQRIAVEQSRLGIHFVV